MPRLRVVTGGTITAAGEWSCTAEYSLSNPIASLTTLQSIANQIFSNLNGSTNFKAILASDTAVRSVKLLYYPNVTGLATLVAIGAGTPFSGTITATHAPQVCVVASLRTNFAGRAHRGRQYWPYRGPQVAASGVVNSGGQAFVSTAALAHDTAVKSALVSGSNSGAWVVYSTTGGGLMTPVTNVAVGTQCDTQRRRNPNRDETYTLTPVAGVTVTPDEVGANTVAEAQEVLSEALGKDIDWKSASEAGQILGTIIGVAAAG